MHANFLELNMLSQIRALPNPASGANISHPVTLRLTPTSTASVVVTSVAPASSSPFVKISPDAEVIVAPKMREKAPTTPSREGQSSQSVGGRSGTSTARTKVRKETTSRAIFLRGVDRNIAGEWFEEDEVEEKNQGLRIWVAWSVLTSQDLKGNQWVWVSIVRPMGLKAAIDPQKQAPEDSETVKVSTKVIARICPWEDAPDARHVALSSPLCKVLDAEAFLGETIRIEAASSQIPKGVTTTLRVFPFTPTSSRAQVGFKFGGKSKNDRDEAVRRLQTMFGKPSTYSILDGPLTDGMLLPAIDGSSSWEGGLLKFDPPPGPTGDSSKSTRAWLLGSERKLNLEVMSEITKQISASTHWAVGESIATTPPHMVGINTLISQLLRHIRHSSSVLLTGGLGSGKTSLAQLLAHRLRCENLFTTVYFPCRNLVSDEARVTTIKETLIRVFETAAWNSRLAGHAVVILDDMDKLSPTETELEIGDANGRSRQISEIIASTVRKYCTRDSRVVLLATAQSKEALNNVIIGSHVVREIVNLPAPDKETRRTVLETLACRGQKTGHVENQDATAWLGNGDLNGSPITGDAAFQIDPTIDFLDLAGQTDGYMPGDLSLLVSRARSEALIRTITINPPTSALHLTTQDFTSALKGFTPSSLRNVTLQHSTTRFSSIGGLVETRKILLETLQYPTLYAPIFARCPLRLRSGLLLYGYPGCGKTLLASAVAGECGLNFISVKGPEILNKYIGASEKSVRDLFDRAQAARPCVLFFDEFDSVAPRRGHDSTGVTDRVVNQLLTQMDGAEGLSGVYVLAATSRPDLIDPALLRPGRLDKSLLCDMPSQADRADILRALSGKLKMDPKLLRDDEGDDSETLNEVARRTDGYSGADLQAVVYNAHLEAIHDVLGDRESPSSGPAAVAAVEKDVIDFTYFRYGDTTSTSLAPSTPAGTAHDRAAITQHLVALRKHSSLQASSSPSASTPLLLPGATTSTEPTIHWPHVQRALATTRASISRQEQQRLARIYRDFVVGQKGGGEIRDAGSAGARGVGGRSSLM